MKLKKYLTLGILGALLVSGNALAETSSTTISKNQSSAYGSKISIN